MTKQAIVAAALVGAIGLGGLAVTDSAHADNFFRSMNPFKWFFGDDWDDDYDHHYRYGRYGWGGPYGWYGPGWGAGNAGTSTVILLKGDDQSSDDSATLASSQRPE